MRKILYISTLSILLVTVLNSLVLFAQTSQTVSPHGDLSIDISCTSCHNAESWVPAKATMDFNHDTQTNFPLIGKHGITDCESCHLNLNFSEPTIIGEGCETCHVDVHQGAFSQSCTDCHNQESFNEVDGLFIHNRTAFPLTGAHQQIECESCHVDQSLGHFVSVESECIDCHEQDYNEAETIDHVESGFPLTCEDCHTTLAWQPAFFDHITASQGFALIGAHTKVDCASCHVFPSMDLVFTPSSNEDCISCHEDDYQDEHGGSGFPTTCLACHNMNSWDDADFEHVAASGGFELLGSHRKLDCKSCHTSDYGLVFNPPPADQEDCYNCHVQDYQKEHGGSGFPTDCKTCHNVNDWDDAEFEHVAASGGFELLGAHDKIDCSSCHTSDNGLVFSPPPDDQEDCYSCHVQDYQKEHGGSGFPTDCKSCHNVNDWDDAEFKHVDVSGGFELLGAHGTANCESCHTPDMGLVFSPPPANQEDCYSCHAQDYETEHAGTNFSTTCTTCHNVNTWDDTNFKHADVSNGFELLGAHNSTTCESCHNSDYSLVFSPPPTSQEDCYSCHAQDYEKEHAGTGFPTDCSTCHNVNTWDDATFTDHDNLYFPIFSGEHRGEWSNNCQTCHVTPADFSVFECINCHEHRKSEMDDEHRGISNYVFLSTACYSCHPDGKADD